MPIDIDLVERAALFEARAQTILNSVKKPIDFIVVEAVKPPQRVNLCQEKDVMDIGIAYSGDAGLVEQEFLNTNPLTGGQAVEIAA